MIEDPNDLIPEDAIHAAEGRPSVDVVIEELLSHDGFKPQFAHIRRVPPRPAKFGAWPAGLHPDLVAACRKRGIESLYSHQSAAIEHALAGRNTVTITPTASGKTQCYNLPVINGIMQDPEARAIYLFPTKALSHDQYREVHDLCTESGREIRVFTYDGDTPPATRRALRAAGHIVVTNPDMLHCGILPHHTNWVKLFENLKYVVIDELHQYRGVFGSHLANVLRRLNRLAEFYGAKPIFLASSATIANPKELAQELTGKPFEVVAESGAPTGEKVFVFYNPPVINAELNVRRSVRLEVRRLALRFVSRGLQTIVFGRSRLDVEVMTTYLKRGMTRLHRDPSTVCGYRSGYLPTERRAIEEGVKTGRIVGVVSTNALELGVDIGGLDVSILAAWPGTVASAWQQSGRSGRKGTTSVTVLVAGSSPLDQFMMNHPEFFFEKSPEAGIVNPDNLQILTSHLKCAAFELPILTNEKFGDASPGPILQYLNDEHVLRLSGDRFHYANEAYPAEDVSLRGGAGENFIVLDTGNNNKVIAEVDFDSAPFIIHDDAIYIHNGKTHIVEKLDWDRRTAYVRAKRVDYYTDAESSSNVQVLEIDSEAAPDPASPRATILESKRFGDVSVATVIRKFKKVKFETQESIGYGPVNVPQLEIQTESTWFTFRTDLVQRMKGEGFDAAEGLAGFANLLRNTVPLFVLCDPRDFSVMSMVRSPFDQRPAIFLWDRYPGGIGLARKLFSSESQVLAASLAMARECRCEHGCPACIGAQVDRTGGNARKATIWLAERLVGGGAK